VTEAPGKVMVVDDEGGMRKFLNALLQKEGYEVELATSGTEAIEKFRRGNFDLVVTDVRMDGIDGIGLLRQIKKIDPDAMVVVITAYTTWSTAVEAMRLGAFDYLTKPFDNENLKNSIARAISSRRMYKRLDRDGYEPFLLHNLIGQSGAIQDIRNLIRRVAPTDATVIIQGESGVGKELVARALHAGSLRSHEAFIAVNCGAFTQTLLESELFGHVRGAFTGAVADKKGLFEVAHKGTLLLDEAPEMSPETQVKLLRVLEERELKPVGGTKGVRVDIRVLAAANRPLEEEVEKGNFREDLFWRLNVISINIPPLRERKEDIPLLVGHFIAKYCELVGKEVKSIDDEAMDALMSYDWRGNVREVDNVIHRAVTLCEGDTITAGDIIGRIRTTGPPGQDSFTGGIPDGGVDLMEVLEDIERKYILAALEKTGNNVTKAAELLKTTFRSLRYRIKKLGIKR